MRIVKFDVSGDYGHFKIPYCNNNPLTHSMITKTALIGMIGAVTGIERSDMKALFPIISESIKYSVKLNNRLKKESVSFYMKNFNNYSVSDKPNKTPKQMEVIKNPSFTVYVVVETENEAINLIIDKFVYYIENGFSIWKPTLGIKQCDCVIENIKVSTTGKYDSEYNTQTFVSELLSSQQDMLIYSDSLPTYQDNNWFNDPSKYIDVKFSDNGGIVKSKGVHYKFENDCIFAI
jgi:CRISPR-associated protein Cas5h